MVKQVSASFNPTVPSDLKKKNTICPVCRSVSKIIFTKNKYDYYECTNCKSLFVPGGIDQSNMVGGGFEVERNTIQNEERINRFRTMTGIYGSVLDFGCGHGMLVNDCRIAGLSCDGYDKFNDKFNYSIRRKYNLISMIEVIEHLSDPYEELNTIFESLQDNGVIYIETSFVDVAIEENIPLKDFFYINPDVGHCTIFSHKGLDILMQSRGFTPEKHINRNTRVYQKKKKMMTLITPTQGNPIALKRTIDSLDGVINEVIVGSVCVFEKDEDLIESYSNGEVNLKLVKFPFNYIFCNGFSNILNDIAKYATNDWVLYLNVGEVVEEGKDEILSKLSNDFNCYYIDHSTETHHWYRVYNKREMGWGGIIHEEIAGKEVRACDKPLFRFADTDKDDVDSTYGQILNSVKECVYFNLYLKLAEQPHLIDNTNIGWVQFAKDGYHSFVERLHEKGDLYEAFIRGDKGLLEKYIRNIRPEPELSNQTNE